jgi:voltage-gated potassium channel
VASRPDDERLQSLRDIPLFADLSEATLQRILECANEFECPGGQVLVQTNQPGAGLFVIEEGKVAVEFKDRRIVLGEGQFFGELALLDVEAVHAARVRTETPVRCLAIRRDDFDGLLASEPAVAISMLKVLARRLAAAARS